VVFRPHGAAGAKDSNKYREALDYGQSDCDPFPDLVLGALFLFVFILVVYMVMGIGSADSRLRYGGSNFCPTCGSHAQE